MRVSPEWDGRVVVVTGGSTGIGRATAHLFAARGAQVVVTGRRPDRLAEAAEGQPRLTSMVSDARDPEDAERTVAAITSRFGRLDVLVNNAGMFAALPLAEADATTVADLFAVNVIGPTVLTRSALPHLRESRGSVVNISSAFGTLPAPGFAHYGASKTAIDALTRSWALELAADGIRVNAVAPGPVYSDALAAAGLPATVIEQIHRDEAARVPLGRRGQPAEIADWVVALADPGAAWVTGQVIAIDGGLTLT
ncbi:SDR family NAD(P)-dependent oxidoreductase [Micromonospora musae]|uniref:SDR family oxidoreductase n=1 Tax=Micromonospora musae TaxID=1894970 RepID=A0A3A9XVI2_9ACTN|nr:SDR family oxidoreductase [Micromonospora musae]RKN29128.1 SDR family oxidoreductase [Micromonospora musae]